MLLTPVYGVYTRWLRRQVVGGPVPRHVALVMDGNRRWAKQTRKASVSVGHRHGARHLDDLLDWCVGVGIHHVTVFVASIDNLRKRDTDEVRYLTQLIEEAVQERLSRTSDRWRVRVAGRLEVLPDSTRHALKSIVEATSEREGWDLTMAIGYDGRQEITDALRDLLDERARAGATIDELAETLCVEDIAAHLYTSGQPDPDLIIRTSGEQRLSGFLLWQAVRTELYFCDTYWPGFREVDFLRALRAYGPRRERAVHSQLEASPAARRSE
jgi:short-chain Z-isoprenyl diphosphate synthase